MKYLIISGLLSLLFTIPAMAQTKKTGDVRPQVGKFCKLYRAGEGLIVSLVRVGPETNNEMLVGFNGFDHPWEGKIFKANVVTADGRQEFTIQNNGRPFVVLVMRERYGQSTVFVPKYGTEQVERPVSYAEELSGRCDPDIFLSQYLNQQAGKK